MDCSLQGGHDFPRSGDRMERITSAANRWVKLAGQLKIKKYRDREGRFLMEGVRSGEDAAAQGRRGAVCFVTEAALQSRRVQRILDAAKNLGWLPLLVEEPLMKKISGTEHGQGMVCLFQKEVRPLPAPGVMHGRYVLLDGVQDPGNMGTILRTAAAAGCAGVFLLEGCTDPYAEKAVRSSMGSILRIPVYDHVTVEAVRAMAEEGIFVAGTALEGGVPYRDVLLPETAVIAFGNEGQGISPEVLALCGKKLFIPMAGTVESLNVAASAAVILFHYKKD